MKLIDVNEKYPELFLDDINYIFEGILLIYREDLLIGQIVYSSDSDMWIFIKCIDVDNHSYSDSTLKTLISFLRTKYGYNITMIALTFD